VFRSTHAVVAIVAVQGLAGCAAWIAGPNPDTDLRSQLRESPGYISDEVLNRIRTDGLTVEQVKILLGEPAAAATADLSPAIGYMHCVSFSAQCKFWELGSATREYPCGGTLCQVTGVWFDSTGHAIEAVSSIWDESKKTNCPLAKWLKVRGGREFWDVVKDDVWLPAHWCKPTPEHYPDAPVDASAQ
jgi:hypothetical protein